MKTGMEQDEENESRVETREEQDRRVRQRSQGTILHPA